MSKRNKQSAVEQMYYRYFNNVGVSIMKLGEVSRKIETIIKEGGDEATIDGKMKALVSEYGEKQAA